MIIKPLTVIGINTAKNITIIICSAIFNLLLSSLKELIKFLKEKNIKIAIASSSSFEKIHTRFKQANLDINEFDYVIGGDMVTSPKPDPQIYLKSCEVLNVKPENAIALEDSDSGIKSAVSAGMKAILIPDIKSPSEETLEIAYKKFDNLLEVIELLN